jgi:hypothetical protein
VPGRPSPGALEAARPLSLGNCRSVVLGWGPAAGARDYLVTVEGSPLRLPRAWSRVASLPTTGTRVDVGQRLRLGTTYRWVVQARGPQGQTGPATPWLHFTCEYQLR